MEEKYTLREVGADELNAVEPLLEMLAEHHRTMSKHFPEDYTSAVAHRQFAEYAQDLHSGKGRAAVIMAGHRAVAFCIINIMGRTGYIDELGVLPEHRGQGFGTRLMDWAFAAFAQAGVDEVELMVVEGNGDAMRFYERYGFRTASRVLKRSVP